MIGNDAVDFIAVEYNTPTAGASTWYYTVTSGCGPAISHTTFGLAGCYQILDAGIWNGVNTNSRVSGGGSPVPGAFPAPPQSDPTTGILGLKFDLGFAGGEVRHYYFTVNANAATGTITVATEGGSGYDAGLLPGPIQTCIPLALVLADFSAACEGTTPVVSWETVSEITNQGFNLYRSDNPAAPEMQLNSSMIPSQGPGSTQGFAYSWPDITAVTGVQYYYWLEDVNLWEATHLTGPISGMCQAPTSVSLAGISAGTKAETNALPLTLAVVVAVSLLGGLVWRRLVRTT